MGLYATKRFEPEDVICTKNDNDRIITVEHYEAEVASDPTIAHYALRIDSLRVIIPDRTSGGWHLVNNSCKPNARLTEDLSGMIVAKRVIEPDEEITCWYGWKYSTSRCECGEKFCGGWIGVAWYPEKIHSTGSRKMEDYERLIDCAVKNETVEALSSLFSLLIVDQRWSHDRLSRLASKVLGEKSDQAQLVINALWEHFYQSASP
jgi:hypothetical protein